MSGQIFISYRSDDSAWAARDLYDRLCGRFDRIFMDFKDIVVSVEGYENVSYENAKLTEKTVAECDVLIAVIGAHWLTSKDEQDRRRLDSPEDCVRREISTALKRDIRVIPVLVDGASMPRSTDLPDDLKPLVRRNALQVTDTGFDDDCRRLAAAIEEVLEKATPDRREREKRERLQAERYEREEKEGQEAERRETGAKEPFSGVPSVRPCLPPPCPPPPCLPPPCPPPAKLNTDRVGAPTCKAPEPVSDASQAIDRVNFSVFAPGVIRPARQFLLDLWVHLPTQTDAVTRLTREFARDRRLGVKPQVAVAHGAALSVVLDLPSLRIRDPSNTIFWNGEPDYASFVVEVPADVAVGDHPGRVIITASGIPIAKVTFCLSIEAEGTRIEKAPRELPTVRQQPHSAFASFSGRDRKDVLGRVQGMTKVCQDLDVFVDALSLRSGQDWEVQIRQQIPARDVFFLFWSLHASHSKEVEKEWRIALEMRGLDFIDPIPLTDPRVSPPPKELARLHFNDLYIAQIQMEESLKKLRKRFWWKFWRRIN